MNKIKLIVDSGGDFTKEQLVNYELQMCCMNFSSLKHSFLNDPLNEEISNKDFFNLLREKEDFKTAQISTSNFMQKAEPFIKEGYSIIYLSFSSALSGTYNSVNLGKDILLETYPDAKIAVIDTLCASLGQGYLSVLVANYINEDHTFEEAVDYAEKTKLKIIHLFTVDDIGILARGGRLTATKAFVAKTLSLKPCLRVNELGQLVSYKVAHGRVKAFQELVAQMLLKFDPIQNSKIWIGHADDINDAIKIKKMIISKLPNFDESNIEFHEIGPIIGSHVGPGMISLFFLSQDRSIK